MSVVPLEIRFYSTGKHKEREKAGKGFSDERNDDECVGGSEGQLRSIGGETI